MRERWMVERVWVVEAESPVDALDAAKVHEHQHTRVRRLDGTCSHKISECSECERTAIEAS